METELAKVTALVNSLGEEYRSGQSNSQQVRKKLEAAIRRKVKLQMQLG